ncbi:MAG: transposase [Planctomycetes bacterium]|nr:transposase [Planctomycetota bacterium]
MRTVRDPCQPRLVDMFDGVISAASRLRMADGWQATFRHFVLQELPALRLGDHLNASRGRPSSELYSMCGLLLLRHFHDWTVPETLEAVLFRSDVQCALNLESGFEISQRTIERYLRELQADEGLAQEMMTTVTDRLVATLELRIHHQRLDSTHVVSNMASFGRTRLMAVAVKRFLKALHRHQRTEFEALSEEFRARYDSSDQRLFGQNSTPEDRQRNRQQVAEDLFLMLERFAPNKEISQWVIYQRLQTLFGQQCEIVEEQVQVRKSTGGDVIQNPSDPDATYSGHKGAGYQVQLAETCDPENEQQLILAAIPQTAAESDSHALILVLEELQSRDHLPETMLADCSYGSDENMQQSTAMGVNLVSPVPGGATHDPQRLGPEHFTQDAQTHKVTACFRAAFRCSGRSGDSKATPNRVGANYSRKFKVLPKKSDSSPSDLSGASILSVRTGE